MAGLDESARGDSTGGYTPPAGAPGDRDRRPSPSTAPETARSRNPNEIAVGTEFVVK